MARRCPFCTNVDLLVSHRHNVEIDYCPQCQGVWLDRGELDRIAERAARFSDYDHEPDDGRRYGVRPFAARDRAVEEAPRRGTPWSELFD